MVKYELGKRDTNGYAEQASDEELASEISKRQIENLPPMHVFHDNLKPLNALIRRQYDIDNAFIMTTLLSFTSTAIGSALRVGNEFMSDPLLLWTTLVGISSSGKSLIQKILIKPLEEINASLEEQYNECLKEEKGQTETWKIQRPKLISQHDLFETFTKEVLPDSPKGVIRLIEEQKAWIESMDAYKSKGGIERQFWLQAWSPAMDYEQGRSGRKTFKIKKDFLNVNVYGGTQPLVVKRFFTEQLVADGFSFRCLFALPEKVRIAYPDFTMQMPENIYQPYKYLISTLYDELPVKHVEDIAYIRIQDRAERMLNKWVKSKGQEIEKKYHEDMPMMSAHSSLVGKIRQYINRFAGILKTQDAVFDGKELKALSINEDTMERATKLGEYYYNSFIAVFESVHEQIYIPIDVLKRAATFKACNCNYSAAAEILGISKATFWRQINKDIKQYPSAFGAKNT